MKKILFVCTGNSCRSQMAEGLARNMGWHAFSAGTKPEIAVSQNAITAMNEIGIDISTHYPKLLNKIKISEMDVIMTVCSNADKSCPGFEGEKIHYSFIRSSKCNWNI
jgi:arsenate reductase (thioredoxin)